METMGEKLKKMGFTYDDNDLNKTFLEACKDLTFKKCIDDLNFSLEEVKKHTSTLKECVHEKKNCQNCASLLECKNKITGYCYTPRIVSNSLQFNYEACPYQLEILDRNKYLKNIYYFNLPKEIKEASMEKIEIGEKKRAEVITWLTQFIKNYKEGNKQKGLYLHGNFGCGKTYLIAASFNELAKKDNRCAIVYWPEFLRDLKSSFDTDWQKKFDYMKQVPLLLIDDIGAENLTAWARDEILGPLLQYRMQDYKTTFFTSNLTLEELEQHLSNSKTGVEIVKARRIIERIKQLTISQEMIGKNRRK